MPPTASALRVAVIEAARAGHLDADLARRALAVLAHATDDGGVAALRAGGLPQAVVDWLVERARHASTRPGTPQPSAPGSSSTHLSSSFFARQLPPGTRIGAYTVEGELGRGGMGVVLRARDDSGRPVALKLVLGARDTSLRRFSREIAALAALDHPHVVRYLGSGDEPSPWLAMELVEGEDLKAILERVGRLTPEVTARLLAGVARGVAHAHEHGIVHRDLKPSNVLVRTGGEAVVTDFGLARNLEASRFTQTGAMLGTLATMAPEQVRGEKAGPPADVWALGVMLFVCLTGRSPFDEGDTAGALTTAIVQQRIPSPRALDPTVPEDLDATCRACLEREPARRPTALQVAQALRARRAPVRRGRQGARRGPALALAGVVAAGGVAAAVVGVALRAREAPHAQPAPPTTGTPPLDEPPPWGPPGTGWAVAWSLAASAPEVEAPALWDEAGRVAAPLAAVLEGRPGARAAGLLGRAREVEGGRLSVAYDHDALFAAPTEPAKYVQAAAAPYALVTPVDDPPRAALLRSANDASFTTVWLGAARWRDAGLSLRWRRHAREDAEDLALVAGIDGSARRVLWFSGRGGRAGCEDASVPLGDLDAWRRVRFVPGAAAGARVLLDDATVPALDAAATSPAGPGRVGLELGEAFLAVADVEVEGALLRPDRPALAWAPAPLPTHARVAAAFERAPERARAGLAGGTRSDSAGDVSSREAGERSRTTHDTDGLAADGVAGGPLVALGAPGAARYTLELDGEALRLRRGDRLLASRPAAAGAGWLLLERAPGDVVRGVLVAGSTRVALEVVDPLPLAASPLRAGWGSAASRVTFSRVEAHAGPDDPARAALDAAAVTGGAALVDALGRADDPVGLWRRGAVWLALVSDPEWFDPALMGHAGREARRALAAEAADALAAAVERGLRAPASDEARVRAVLARVVAADAAGAALAATRAVEALGLDPVRARFDPLERSVSAPDGSHEAEVGALLRRFTEGYYPVHDVAVRDAALAAAEVLVPERLGAVLANRAGTVRHRGLDPRTPAGRKVYEEAAAMFERARAAGADEKVVDSAHADVLMDLGRVEDALEIWERARAHSSSNWWVWARRGACLQALERREDALASFVGALACAPTRPDVQRYVMSSLQVGAPPGLGAAALLALADARGDGGDALRGSALDAARAGAADPGRDGDLARYVLVRLGAASDGGADSRRPTAVLARARAGAADARDALPAAAAEDPLVGHLASLDPALRTLLGR